MSYGDLIPNNPPTLLGLLVASAYHLEGQGITKDSQYTCVVFLPALIRQFRQFSGMERLILISHMGRLRPGARAATLLLCSVLCYSQYRFPDS